MRHSERSVDSPIGEQLASASISARVAGLLDPGGQRRRSAAAAGPGAAEEFGGELDPDTSVARLVGTVYRPRR
jgi:hypothetical protein